MMVKGEWNGMNWVLNKFRYISIIKEKQSKNRRKTKNRTKTGKTDCAPPTTGRCGSHGQPVVGSVWPGPDLSHSAAFCLPLVLRLGPRILPMLGHFGSHLLSSLIHMAPTSFFFLLLGLSHMNLQSKLEKPKTSVIGEIGA